MKNPFTYMNARLTTIALTAGLMVASCGQQETTTEASAPATAAAPEAVAEPTPESAAPEAPKRGLDDALAEMDPSCNAELAQKTMVQCRVCHSLEEGQRNLTGPNLFGVYERAAATTERFAYSPKLRDAGLVWDEATLDAFLENPPQYLPGNRMAFGGVRDAEARAALICLLKALR